jgi:hypothetical protein
MNDKEVIEKLKNQLRDTRFVLRLWNNEKTITDAPTWNRFNDEIENITKTLAEV